MWKYIYFVFQDKISEKINDPGYMLKGIYYYPCLGSGIFLNGLICLCPPPI